MDEIDRHLINSLQGQFPVCSRPFARVAQDVGTDESEVISRIRRLLDEGILTRFGPLYNAERLGGALSLCALNIPPEQFDAVNEIVNGFDEVAHNYERDHALNMWFVLAVDSTEAKRQVIASIEQQTGLTVYDMPKQREYFVGLHFEV